MSNSNSVPMYNIYYDEDLADEILAEEQEEPIESGMVAFFIDVFILEKKGKNLKTIKTWNKLFSLAQFGSRAKLLDYDSPEVNTPFIEFFEEIDDFLPLKIMKKDATRYLVSVDKKHELYDYFFSDKEFIKLIDRVEKNFGNFTF